jgi:glycine/D-amino acid oxidase-like deaminating enzyme
MNIECDVLVAGGGAAGVPAAVAAARGGARTVLIEANAFLGGTGVAGLHRSVCGLYGTDRDPPEAPLNGGLAAEIVSRLLVAAPHRKPMRMGRVFVLPFAPHDLAAVFLELTRGETNLQVLTGMRIASVARTGNRISAVAAESGEGHVEVRPHVVIECTGAGAVLTLGGIGHAVTPPAKQQLAGFTVHLKGLESPDDTLPVRIPQLLGKAVDAEKAPAHLRFTFFSGGEEPDEGYLKLSLPPDRAGEQDAAMADAVHAQHLLAEALPAFRNAAIAQTSVVVHREGPRLNGEYALTADDVLGGHRFDDGVVKNAWPIELWNPQRGPSLQYLRDGDHYDIPLRCLRSPEVANLLCAGRCISVSRKALGSTRVMGTCMALGAAAGREAARLAK